ncbi:MAG TPA: S9 family peptidase [Gemmatimonadales bacterium]|nr:S9 family peptidase [Gemmatimonadales bacterium]
MTGGDLRAVRQPGVALIAGALTLSVAPALSLGAQAPARHPITHEDVWLMPRLGAPVPSPDGRWVVFAVTEPAYDDSAKVEDLWIVPADGSTPPRRLTTAKGRESEPAWSPDGGRIAFVARRGGDDVSQVYVLDLAGGEARRVTELSGGAWTPRWRPDGGALLVTTGVWRGARDETANRRIGEERKARKYRARTYEGGGRIRYWDRWLEDRTPQLAVVEPDSATPPRLLFAASRLAERPGYAGRFTDEREVLDADWTPDGSGVVFAAAVNADRAAYEIVRSDLFLVSAAGGEPAAITSGPDSYASPRFSPDGGTLAAIVELKGPRLYALDRLAAWAWPGPGARTVLTARFDRSVSSWAFTPAGDSIYLTAEDAGHEKLYRVGLAGPEVRLAHDLGAGGYTGLAIPERAAGAVLLARWESAVSPPEIYRVAADGRRAPLTALTRDRAAAIAWQPAREFTFRSRRGRAIHNLLVLPPGFDSTRSYPLFVMMHGGPHTMWRDQFFIRWNYHLLGAPGYVVLLTNYTGSTGFGEAFAQAIEGDPFATPADEINQAADEAIRRFPFVDGGRQCAGGASYGGHLANWMQATTTRYRCLINHAGLMNAEAQWATSDISYPREVGYGGPPWEGGRLWREQNPVRRAARFRTPMLVTVGEKDYRVPLNNALETWTVLQRLRIPSRLVVFPDENHWILKGEDSRFFYAEVHAWLARHLGAARPADAARQ